MSDRPAAMVSYQSVDAVYLRQRALHKAASWKLLWALGVGAVISGDYFGWNFGLEVAGFGGLAAATLLMAAMYTCMVFSIAELSAALPHAGGFYSFARSALGPTGGYLCGVTDTIEYVITPAVIVVAIGGYLKTLMPEVSVYLLWASVYGLFVAINVYGVELTLKVGLGVTLAAVLVLMIFYASAISTGAFSAELLFNIEPEPGEGRWFPKGASGVFAALPFAMWFYLAIEQLPLAAEETHDVVRDMPRALLLAMLTLFVLSGLTLLLNTGVGGGAVAIAVSEAPLGDGFRAVFGASATSTVLTLVAIAGLVASFHTIMYAYGRVLFALSRAGYFPRSMSLTGQRKTPWVALVGGALAGYVCAALIESSQGEGNVGAALLNMAVFGAVISYCIVMISFIVLRRTRPELPRPYRSPLGVPGAVVGGGLAAVALAATFTVEAYRPGIWGVAVFVVVAMAYFLLYSRHRLVAQAPEEEVALIERAESELAHK